MLRWLLKEGNILDIHKFFLKTMQYILGVAVAHVVGWVVYQSVDQAPPPPVQMPSYSWSKILNPELPRASIEVSACEC